MRTHLYPIAAVARHDPRLEVGQSVRLDLALTLGENRTTIDVGARAETATTQDASLGEVVEANSVANLPLNGRMLLDMAPVSHVGHGAQTGTMNPLY
jgi:hypothetical protein